MAKICFPELPTIGHVPWWHTQNFQLSWDQAKYKLVLVEFIN